MAGEELDSVEEWEDERLAARIEAISESVHENTEMVRRALGQARIRQVTGSLAQGPVELRTDRFFAFRAPGPSRLPLEKPAAWFQGS